MNFTDLELPSNKKFGFVFTIVFSIISGYFYSQDLLVWTYIFAVMAAIFITITIINANYLLPLNKVWMRFGLLLGIIVSPIVLGVIFFGLFTPIAFLMRISGRDELRLNFRSQASYWVKREAKIHADEFKRQF